MGAKHPEFCQKPELRAINSQSVCTQQACYLNADASPVNFDDCLSSYFSMSIMSLLLFSPLSFSFIFSIHYSLSVFQLSIKAPLPRDRGQIDKHLPIKCSIFFLFTFRRRVFVGTQSKKDAPSRRVFPSKAWHRRSHICHSETVQLNRL